MRKLKHLVYAFITTLILCFILQGCSSELSSSQSSTSPKENETNSASSHEKLKKETITENSSSAKADLSARIPVTLIRTVDGDTIKVSYKGKEETIRYLLVDTPESKKPGTCVQPFAKSAYERNNQLVTNGKLTIEFDNGNERDKYGRLLAYVFVNGKSVQEKLLKEGFARVAYIYEPSYKYLEEFQSDENIAQMKHLNIWSNEGLVTDNGFNGCATNTKTTPESQNNNSNNSGESISASSDVNQATQSTSTETEVFANCTELRKKYTNGVPSTHPAYQSKMDRDHDQYACER